jgi:tRNA(Ile)-lysidine synthase TilS/MesJ
MLKYCVRCVMPHTKPDLHLDSSGVCNACRAYEQRNNVDWDARRAELLSILNRYRRGGSHWDCIVPVSGGKDSTYQVVRMLQLGLNPLCVTSTTCNLSDIGRKNIENIKRLGVDYVEFSPNALVRARLNRIGLTEVGPVRRPADRLGRELAERIRWPRRGVAGQRADASLARGIRWAAGIARHGPGRHLRI